MLKWLPYPMVRIAAFFAGGVLTGVYCLNDISFELVISLLTGFIFCFFSLKFYAKHNLFHVALGFFGLTSVFLFGLARVFLYTNSGNENNLSKVKGINTYEAIVRSVPEEKSKSWKVEVDVVAVKTNHKSSLNVWQEKLATGNWSRIALCFQRRIGR